ncbi:MAG: hypothetical protein A3F72_09780 [Bacteroidetes bacterium RIFCSPLOWO2_12_FULL_35_15]|nr:MAG: hypothetical protein A3F72_09780 [Bacteroidetes bacterium RIFCSPLOWO2_12_FULL_35_15]
MTKTTFISIIFISAVLSTMSCKKKDDPAPAASGPTTPATLTINSSYQASFSLDGTAISYIQSNPDFSLSYGAGGSIGSGGSPTNREFNASAGLQSTNAAITITKGTLTVVAGGYPSNSEFLAFFPAGAVGYAPATSGSHNGIVVSYWDGTTNWTSDNGTADQTGSVFNFVATKNVANPQDYDVKFYATFNCKLYDGAGNMKTLTNGNFIGDFANI